MIVVKYNNVSRHEACALCQSDTKAPNGPALFKEGTWEPVCPKCAKEHAPELALMVKRWQAHDEGTVREALAQFQQALDDYEDTHFLAMMAWDKVQATGAYSDWQCKRDKSHQEKRALATAKEALSDAMSTLEVD